MIKLHAAFTRPKHPPRTRQSVTMLHISHINYIFFVLDCKHSNENFKYNEICSLNHRISLWFKHAILI